jgi:hypothetical protein
MSDSHDTHRSGRLKVVEDRVSQPSEAFNQELGLLIGSDSDS